MKISTIIVLALSTLGLFSCAGDTSGKQEETTTGEQADQSTSAEGTGTVKQITVMQLSKMLEADVPLNIIDVRSPDEIKDGKIEGAMEIEFESDDFDQKIEPLEREKSYILYCAAGGRSTKAAKRMLQKGFKSVYNLEGGYDAWVAETTSK